MWSFSLQFQRVRLDTSVPAREIEILAARLTQLMIQANQVSLLSFNKKATGETLMSIKAGGARIDSATYQQRQVVAGGGWKFIHSGRRAGAKMPVYYAGAGPRGGKIFEPLPRMLAWFTALGIPRSAWFPIMRRISRRGIRPRNVAERALRNSRGEITSEAKQAGYRIARSIVRVG